MSNSTQFIVPPIIVWLFFFTEDCTTETQGLPDVFDDCLVRLYRFVLNIACGMPNVQQFGEIQTLCYKVERNGVKHTVALWGHRWKIFRIYPPVTCGSVYPPLANAILSRSRETIARYEVIIAWYKMIITWYAIIITWYAILKRNDVRYLSRETR